MRNMYLFKILEVAFSIIIIKWQINMRNKAKIVQLEMTWMECI